MVYVQSGNYLRRDLQNNMKVLKWVVFYGEIMCNYYLDWRHSMSVSRYDTFENDVEIYSAVERNKSKIIDYVSQPDLWNTPIKKSNSVKELVKV